MPDISELNGTPIDSVAEFDGLTVPPPVATPVAAYSVRLLGSAVGISSYTGDCLRVRRASDNVEADIAFDAGELKLTSGVSNTSDAQSYTDFADFVDHTGTPTDAFVRYWYDQSGNANDAGQSTAGSQPQIYDATTGLITKNGKPSLSFDGSGDNLQYAGNFLGGSAATGVSVSSFDNATRTAREIMWGAQDLSGARYDFLITRQASNVGSGTTQNGIDIYVEGDFQTNNPNVGTITDTNQHLYTAIYSDSVRRIVYNNGSTLTTSSPNNLGNLDDATAFVIGADISGAINSIDGQIQEIVIWNSDQEAAGNRTGIETNINGFFSIYP